MRLCEPNHAIRTVKYKYIGGIYESEQIRRAQLVSSIVMIEPHAIFTATNI